MYVVSLFVVCYITISVYKRKKEYTNEIYSKSISNW